MTTPLFEYRLRSTQLLSPVALAACAALSAACAAPPSDDSGHAPPPRPGTIEIARPPRLAERARVPEKQPGFISAEVRGSAIGFAHDASFPPLAAGDVLGGTQGGGYLVRVIAVQEVDATHAVVETTPAALTELLAEGEFHVHYDAREYAAQLDHYIASQRARADEEGERTAAAAQALGVGPSIPLLDLASTSLPVSCGVSAASPAEITADARLTPSLDIDVKIGPRGGLDLRPELKRFRLVASGQLDVNATLHGKGALTAGCTVDLLGLAGGAVSVPLPTLTFWVGPVPVVVTSEVVPVATADLSLSFQAAEVTAEAKTSVGLDAGVDYRDRKWSTVWNPHCSAEGNASIHSSASIGATATVSAGAELRARLYGILGPNLGVVAYARARAESPPPYCTYGARIDGGVRGYAEAALGVSVGPLDLTLAELPLVRLDLVHFDGPELSGELRDAPECRE